MTDLYSLGLLAAIFLAVFFVIQLIFMVWRESHFSEKRRVKKRLMYISAGGKHGKEKLNLYRDRVLKDVGVVEKFMLGLPRLPALDRMLLRSKLPITPTVFVCFAVGLALLGVLLGWQFLPNASATVLLAILLFIAPFIWLRLVESQAMQRFDEQLPEALDLLARAVRSGHALSAGMEMVADEMDDPIKGEFAATVDLGLSHDEAFENLVSRVPSRDLKFFAITVMIQKETGGNIAEIFDNISRLIRERHQFARQVQALTAEGRLSGWILMFLPLLMFLYIYFVNFDYISLLWREELGRIMLVGAVILQIVGMFVISRIVKIEI